MIIEVICLTEQKVFLSGIHLHCYFSFTYIIFHPFIQLFYDTAAQAITSFTHFLLIHPLRNNDVRKHQHKKFEQNCKKRLKSVTNVHTSALEEMF